MLYTEHITPITYLMGNNLYCHTMSNDYIDEIGYITAARFIGRFYRLGYRQSRNGMRFFLYLYVFRDWGHIVVQVVQVIHASVVKISWRRLINNCLFHKSYLGLNTNRL